MISNQYAPSYSCLFISRGLKARASYESAVWRLSNFRGLHALEANEPEAEFICWVLRGEPLDLSLSDWQHIPQEGVRSFLAEAA